MYPYSKNKKLYKDYFYSNEIKEFVIEEKKYFYLTHYYNRNTIATFMELTVKQANKLIRKGGYNFVESTWGSKYWIIDNGLEEPLLIRMSDHWGKIGSNNWNIELSKDSYNNNKVVKINEELTVTTLEKPVIGYVPFNSISITSEDETLQEFDPIWKDWMKNKPSREKQIIIEKGEIKINGVKTLKEHQEETKEEIKKLKIQSIKFRRWCAFDEVKETLEEITEKKEYLKFLNEKRRF